MDTVPNAAPTKQPPTGEQARIITSKAKRVLVNAYAGTGKTTTAVGYAEARPDERMLYMAFNTNIAREARSKFPAWVDCKTGHALAYAAIVPQLLGANAERKLGDMRPLAVARLLQVNPRMGKLIKGTLNAWLCSADEHLTAANIPDELQVPPSQHRMVVDGALTLFKRMCDPLDLDAKLPHDAYLKLWQLQKPDLSKRYDRIICDEGQDLNPTVLDILKRQTTGLLIIGDENQAIYQFRGATNAMRQFDVDERHYLTTSFRFGSGVAAVATALLGTYRTLPRPITGLGKHRTTQFEIDRSQTYCTIARTNAALFDAAVENLKTGKPFHFIGGTERYRFDAMMDAYHLMRGDIESIRDATLKQFTCLPELKNAATATDDRELKFLAKITEGYGKRIPGLIEELKRRHVADVTPKTLQGGIVFTTAHGSKGLEFDQVLLTEDFIELTDEKENVETADKVPDSELNLLYVAATRAERAIHMNDTLRSFLRAIQRSAKHQPEVKAGGEHGQSVAFSHRA